MSPSIIATGILTISLIGMSALYKDSLAENGEKSVLLEQASADYLSLQKQNTLLKNNLKISLKRSEKNAKIITDALEDKSNEYEKINKNYTTKLGEINAIKKELDACFDKPLDDSVTVVLRNIIAPKAPIKILPPTKPKNGNTERPIDTNTATKDKADEGKVTARELTIFAQKSEVALNKCNTNLVAIKQIQDNYVIQYNKWEKENERISGK